MRDHPGIIRALSLIMSALIRDRKKDTDTERKPCEGEGRNWRGASVSLGMPRVVCGPQNLERGGEEIPLQSLPREPTLRRP